MKGTCQLGRAAHARLHTGVKVGVKMFVYFYATLAQMSNLPQLHNVHINTCSCFHRLIMKEKTSVHVPFQKAFKEQRSSKYLETLTCLQCLYRSRSLPVNSALYVCLFDICICTAVWLTQLFSKCLINKVPVNTMHSANMENTLYEYCTNTLLCRFPCLNALSGTVTYLS